MNRILNRIFKTALIGVSTFTMSAGAASADYTLNILHINDLHSRIEPINRFDSTCGAEDDAEGKCFGGVARVKTKLDERRSKLQATGQNVIALDAGDQFQGSLFYTTYKGKVAAEFVNALGLDAMAVGNHEFDDGPQVLSDFIDAVNVPVLSGNTLAGANSPLAGKIPGYIIKDVGGEKIGIVSVLATDTDETSSPGNSILLVEETQYLESAVAEMEADGVNKIVLVSHVGLARDKEIAAAVSGIDVIVGGHSHTLLSNIRDGAADVYPVRVNNPDGQEVPIVQAYAYSKYLGELRVTFDDDGNVIRSAGEPHLLDASVTPAAAMVTRIQELAAPIEELKGTPTGSSTAMIEGSREVCRAGECAMGNLVADAMLDRTADQGVQIAIQNGGGLRASIDEGEITMGEVLTVLPFQNTLATFQLKGSDVVVALENGVSRIEDGAGRFPQIAGMKFVFDANAEPGNRISGVMVADGNGGFSDIDPAATYSIATNNYMRGGGDGYGVFETAGMNAYDFGPGLETVVADYLMANSPYSPMTDGRIAAGAAKAAVAVPATGLSAGVLSNAGPMIVTETMDAKTAMDAPEISDPKGNSHVIVAGDNYWNLAEKFYGDSTMWTKLDQANPDYRTRGLQIGDTLTVPQ